MADLTVTIGSIQLNNPILTASGTFGYGSEVSALYDVNRLGGITTKTITRNPRPGNPPQRIVETPAGMLNSIGLANVGIDAFIKEKLPYLQTLTTKVIVNIAGETKEDFIYLVECLEEQNGISAYELNLSCPNVARGLDFSTDPQLAGLIVSEVIKRTKRPVIPKLTPNVTDIRIIAKAVEDNGAAAVSLINTLVGMSVDIQEKRPRLGNIFGGLSGPAIKPVALAMVYKVSKTVNIPIIGIGGICSAHDVIEFILCGASAVQLGTINFVSPMSPLLIIDGVSHYLDQNKYSSITELKGALRV